jgi:4'-phosphopantetheinyl transferase EntD
LPRASIDGPGARGARLSRTTLGLVGSAPQAHELHAKQPPARLREVSPPVAFRADLAHGHLVGVAIPDAPSPELEAALHPEERAFAVTLAPARRLSFSAGRVALRVALADLGLPAGPALIGARGGPQVPAGARASLSHKTTLAIALAAPADPVDGWGLGVDLEEDRPHRVDIARRVLTPDERAEVATLPAPERAREVLVRFAFKEAFYKAADALLQRFVGFHEVALQPRDSQGNTRFSGSLIASERLLAEGVLTPLPPGHIVVTVRVRRLGETAK